MQVPVEASFRTTPALRRLSTTEHDSYKVRAADPPGCRNWHGLLVMKHVLICYRLAPCVPDGAPMASDGFRWLVMASAGLTQRSFAHA